MLLKIDYGDILTAKMKKTKQRPVAGPKTLSHRLMDRDCEFLR